MRDSLTKSQSRLAGHWRDWIIFHTWLSAALRFRYGNQHLHWRKRKISSSIQRLQLKSVQDDLWWEYWIRHFVKWCQENYSEYATFRICCTSSTLCLCVICRRISETSLSSYFNYFLPPLSLSLVKCVYASFSKHYSNFITTQGKQNTWQEEKHWNSVSLLSCVAGDPPAHHVTGAVWFMIASFQ